MRKVGLIDPTPTLPNNGEGVNAPYHYLRGIINNFFVYNSPHYYLGGGRGWVI